MNKRIPVWVLTTFFLITAYSAEAQQPTKIPRLGFLFIGSKDQPHLESFRQGLRELGYSEGKNIAISTAMAKESLTRCPHLQRTRRSKC